MTRFYSDNLSMEDFEAKLNGRKALVSFLVVFVLFCYGESGVICFLQGILGLVTGFTVCGTSSVSGF